MAKAKNAAHEEVVAVGPQAPEPAPIMYEVTLNRRFTHMDFPYLPSHHHIVDKAIYDAMVEAGVVADVKQLS